MTVTTSVAPLLTLAEANRVIEGAITKARELGVSISVAVVDVGGRLLAFQRMDDAVWAGVYGAIGKATTSAAFGSPSEGLEKIAESPIIKGIVGAAGGGMVVASGALPLKKGITVVGAIGVGGAKGAGDADCARAGAEKL